MDKINLEEEKSKYPVEECPEAWASATAKLKSLVDSAIVNDPDSKKEGWEYKPSDITGKYFGGTKYEWKWIGSGSPPPGQWVRTVVKGYYDPQGCVTTREYVQADDKSYNKTKCKSNPYIPIKITYHFYGPDPKKNPPKPDQLNGHEYYYKPNRGDADTWIRYTVFTNSSAMQEVKKINELMKVRFGTIETHFYDAYGNLVETDRDTTDFLKEQLEALFYKYRDSDCSVYKAKKAKKAAEEDAKKAAERQKEFNEDYNNYIKGGYEKHMPFLNYSNIKNAERAAKRAAKRAKNAAIEAANGPATREAAEQEAAREAAKQEAAKQEAAREAANIAAAKEVGKASFAKQIKDQQDMAPIRARYIKDGPKTVEEHTTCLDAVKSLRDLANAAAPIPNARKRTRSNRSNKKRKSRRN